MKRLKTYTFSVVALLVFLIHQFVEPFYKNAWIDSYLDDICFLPVSFGFIQFIIHHSIDGSFKVNKKQATLGVLITSAFTELVFPNLSAKHTFDPLDVAAYSIGALLFFTLGNKQLKD